MSETDSFRKPFVAPCTAPDQHLQASPPIQKQRLGVFRGMKARDRDISINVKGAPDAPSLCCYFQLMLSSIAVGLTERLLW